MENLHILNCQFNMFVICVGQKTSPLLTCMLSFYMQKKHKNMFPLSNVNYQITTFHIFHTHFVRGLNSGDDHGYQHS